MSSFDYAPTEVVDDYQPEKSKSILACAFHGRGVGIAYWEPHSCRIFVMQSSQALRQAVPAVILLPSKTDDSFRESLSSLMSQNFDAQDNSPELLIRPQREFSSSRGQQLLHQIKLNYEINENEELNADNFHPFQQSNNYAKLPAGLDSSKLSITFSCIAAIATFVNRTALYGTSDGFHISSVETVCLDDILQISEEALGSLDIFSGEPHANIYSNKTQEGLSIFGLLNSTCSTQGKKRLKSWLLRPSRDMDVLYSRHDVIEFFLNPSNYGFIGMIQEDLKIKNILTILQTIRNGRSSFREWGNILKFLSKSISLQQALLSLNGHENVFIIHNVIKSVETDSFRELGQRINEIIDWQESSRENRICIMDGIDDILDNYRHQLNSLPSMLDQIAQNICEEVPSEFTDILNVVYFPQLGYLMSIPLKPTWETPEDHSLEGWEFLFHTETYCYFKDQKMKDLDQHVGDLRNFVADREIEILEELQQSLRQYEAVLVRAHDLMVDLDCLLAFAEAAKRFNWTRPTMSQDNVIRIQGGRHPLIELCTEVYVKNDTSLVGGQGLLPEDEEQDYVPALAANSLNPDLSVMILTGANASGKSAYMKVVGIITILAHCGSFVPADQSLIGLTDKLFTRITTRESVSRAASAFMIDLEQVSEMLSGATSRSLLLIDEFGKGTESADGTGLFCGVVRHLLERGIECPRVILTTHFHSVFANKLLDEEKLPLALAHMELVVDEEENGNSNITYLYRLAEGVSPQSHACICAERVGISRQITTRASEVAKMILECDILKLMDVKMSKEEADEFERAEEVVRAFLSRDLARIDSFSCEKRRGEAHASAVA